MKLAEALSVRADLQRRISQLKSRLKDSSKIQEGDTPAEDVNDLYKELDDCLMQLDELTYRINNTNMQTVHEGETLTRMIARKDTLTLRISVMRDVLKHVIENDRYGRNEIKYIRTIDKYIRTIDIPAFRKEMDAYAKRLRELDLKLQSLNWTVDLI